MKKIGIIGMGKMGTAIHSRIGSEFRVYEFDKQTDLANISSMDIVILAIKPQTFSTLSDELKGHISDRQLIISIMAGIGIKRISVALGASKVIRTMPNISLRYGESLTAVYSSEKKPDKDVLNIISGWGKFFYIETEDQFHSFTALCGSSPAYFLKLAAEIESLAMSYGYPKEIVRTISMNALNGALLSLQKNEGYTKKSIEEIRSKGGVTEEALLELDRNHHDKLVEKAIAAATNRSKELSNEF